MAKNMTRKSVAIGAGIALAASAFAGAPASAAISSLNISPVLGTGTDTVLGATFNMKLLAPGNAGSETIDFYVEGAKAADLTVKSGTAATSFTDVPAIAGSVTDIAVPGESANSNFPLTASSGNYVPFSISLNDANVTATTTVTITPFIDGTVLANEKPDSGELAGSPVTVTFHKASEVSATVTSLTTAAIGASSGDTSSKAVVTLDKNVNMADTVGGVGTVRFKQNGGTAVDSTGFGVAYSVSDAGYVATVDDDVTNMTNLADGDVISAQAFVEGETTGGAVALASVTAGEVASFDGAFTVLANNSFLGTDGSTTDAVREGSGTLLVQATVVAESGKSVANQPVTFTVAETADDSFGGATLTAGGKSLTDTTSAADKIDVVVNTNASGNALLELSYSSLDKTETFDVSASAVGSDVAEIAARTFTATPSTAAVVVSDVDGGDGSAASYSMVKGGNGSVTFFIRDQFGQIPVGTFRANVTIDDGAGSMAALNSTITFSGGQATLNWTDNNSAANTAVEIALDVEKLDSNGLTWTDTSETYVPVLVDVLASAATPNRVTITNSVSSSSTQGILKEDYVTGDERWEAESKSWNTDASITATLTGSVFSSTGGSLPGAEVTVSAPGVLFTNEDKTVYSQDSITVQAARDGGYSVYYASNTVGTKEFTVTSGTATQTSSTKFDGVSEADAASITMSAPDTVAPGSTLTATATVVDKFGNPVAVDAQSSSEPEAKFTYSGPGLTIGTVPVVTSDSNGEMKIQVLLGTNDSGTATVTASFDADGDGSLTEIDENNIVVSKSITIGETAVDYGNMSAWTVDQGDGTAKVYVKFPTIGEKVRIGHQTGGSGSYETIYVKTTTSETMDGLRIVEGVGTYVVRTIDLDSGTNRIRVTVGDSTEVQVRYNE